MGTFAAFLLYSFVVVAIAQDEVDLAADRPFLKLKAGGAAELECCWTNEVRLLRLTWIKQVPDNGILAEKHVKLSHPKKFPDKFCGTLTLKPVQVNDTGLYRCALNYSKVVFTHGTFLQVYKPLEKMINLSERTKNNILKAEGILLFLCVLLPSATLLFQSKKHTELEKKKMKREEENIYQGLNLDDCCSAYDQIERSQGHGPYQDVCNIKEEEEEIQLEKP